MKQEVRDKKIKAIKTKAAVGILTSGIISAALINQFGTEIKNVQSTKTKDTISQESIFEPQTIDNELKAINKNIDYYGEVLKKLAFNE